MKILAACEESQAVCKAFRARGHEAYSADMQGLPCLEPTKIIEKHVPYVNGGCKDAHGNYRRFQGRRERDPKIRSKTFPGVAAMAEQWG